MAYFQFRDPHASIFNHKATLREMRRIDMRSLVGLYVSEFLLFAGIILIFLNNMNVLAPGSYFGAYNYVTVMVFSMGIIINFISIPFLYFSSFMNFKKENDFWDKEIFWILPLFFFGTFFLYGSSMSFSVVLMVVSLLVICFVHVRFFLSSRKLILNSDKEALVSHKQYFECLQYLTFYYLLFFFFLVWYNPIQYVFVWVRYNM
jgi:hypothetical protein